MPQKGAAAPAEAGTATPSAARAETARVRNRDRFMAGLLGGVGAEGRICRRRRRHHGRRHIDSTNRSAVLRQEMKKTRGAPPSLCRQIMLLTRPGGGLST